MPTDPALRWPLDCRARPVKAGSFPIRDREFEFTYKAPTHALHVYEYDAEIQMDGERRILRPGDATISPAGMETRYRLRAPGRHWCIHFEPAPPSPRRSAHALVPLHQPLGSQRQGAADTIARIAWLLGAPNVKIRDTALAAASAALQELLLRLALVAEAGRGADQPLRSQAAVEAVAKRLDERFDQDLDVPALAAAVGLDQNYLARRFRARFGMTIQRYVLARRIERSLLLLGATDMPISRIATLVGFGDAQHFNKQFRRVVGVNPSARRRDRPGLLSH